jgi:uncharacterized protein
VVQHGSGWRGESLAEGIAAMVENGGPEAGKYDNRVAARSLLTMGLYRPFKSLKEVPIPLLIVGATRDTVAPFVEEKIRALENPQIKLETLDANHFDPYFEPALSRNLGYQIAFLNVLRSP